MNLWSRIHSYIEPKVSRVVLGLIFQLTSGITSEKLYWSYVLWKRNNFMEAKRLQEGVRKDIFPPTLLSIIKKYETEELKPKVIELGPGPLSDLAWGVETGLIEVVAIDPLADEYNKILNRRNIVFPIRAVQGIGEDLLLPENSFDIAYLRNSLDHTSDPRKCLFNLVRVLKIKGYLYIYSNVREGTRVGWSGLHQHDLVIEENCLIRYNKDGDRTDLTQGLGLKMIEASQTRDNAGGSLTMVLRKEESLPG
jgi:SAM-dependent methyltransferase